MPILSVYLSEDLKAQMVLQERRFTGDSIAWSKVAVRAIEETISGARAYILASGAGCRVSLTAPELAILRTAIRYYKENRLHFGRALDDVATAGGRWPVPSDGDLRALGAKLADD